MGLLCGHRVPLTLRAAHRALTRVIARTHYDVEPSQKCNTFFMLHLPASKSEDVVLICWWLQRCAC